MQTATKIDALGKRFRDGVFNNEDIRMLEEYRAEFDGFLLSNSGWVGEALVKAAVPAVFAGRSKRTKSTIRKLARPQNANMDLSRMVDMAGIRVVVRDTAAQRQAVDALKSRFFPEDARDYLNDGKPYRAFHLHLREDRGYKRLEIQIRTLPQQLWANESESFGEQVKEGQGPQDLRDYLQELSDAMRSIDDGKPVVTEALKSKYFDERATLSLRLPMLERNFEEAIRGQLVTAKSRTYIVVYDNEVNQLTQKLVFDEADRNSAVQEYLRITRSVDDSRIETLILNSSSDAGLRVTHPRFFPEA